MKEYICSSCGHRGKPKTQNRGSCVLALFLLFCFIVPGLFYLLWMVTGHKLSCPKCKNSTMIPAESPMGQKLIKEFHK